MDSKVQDIITPLEDFRFENSIENRFIFSMILQGVGDAMGYKNGSWEFCSNGLKIHKEMLTYTHNKGVLFLNINFPHWIVSDDTVMSLATAEALIESIENQYDFDTKCKTIAVHYRRSFSDMANRAPGGTCSRGVRYCGMKGEGWNKVPFFSNAGGCGAAMRACPIGLLYSHPSQLPDLLSTSIESGRMSHNCPTGYLGAVAAAVFTSYAIQSIPIHQWGHKFLTEIIPMAKEYIIKTKRDVEENLKDFEYYIKFLTYYLETRNISDGNTLPVFPENYNIEARDKFYDTLSSHKGFPGSNGCDSILIAYDALLGCNGNYEELCLRAMLHCGDNDSTGILAGAWYGALYGGKSIPLCHYKELEYRDRLKNDGIKLYQFSQYSSQ